MKTCKDCIHYDTCFTVETSSSWEIENYWCNDFKDKSRFMELPCSIGDVTYCIAYTENTRAIEVMVFQININEHETVIWIENTEYKTDFWKLTIDQYNEWARFSTKEEAEKKLEEFK